LTRFCLVALIRGGRRLILSVRRLHNAVNKPESKNRRQAPGQCRPTDVPASCEKSHR
jgi:hypothetical protein